MKWGSKWGSKWSTAETVYGEHPIDPFELWNESFIPALVNDPEWIALRNVIARMMRDYLRSQWLIRWRRALTTAMGEQLRRRGEELNYLQPEGWSEDRYRNVLIALLPAALLYITPEIVGNLAKALLDDGQSFTMREEGPCSARFTFLETSADEAVSYLAALNRARHPGCQYFLVAHPGGDASPFVVGTSAVGGPDTLACLFYDP